MNRFRTRLPFPQFVLAVLVAAVVAACGGGGGDDSSVPAPVPPAPPSVLPPATGPGDPLNYAPNAAGDAWTYNGLVSDGTQPLRDLSTVWVNGTTSVRGQLVTVYSERAFSDLSGGPTYDIYYQKGPGGVAYFGNNDPTDTLTAGIVPYAELLFPVAVGPIVSLSKTGVDFGDDLDGDGRNETVDVTAISSITAFEPVTVPAGTFPSAAKRVNTIVANTKLTASGQAITVNVSETTWIAPGAGIVRDDSVTTALGTTIRLTSSVEARGYIVGGVRKGMGNPQDIAPANLGPLTQTNVSELPSPVDSPAVASSGASFLVIAKSYTADPSGKVLLTRKGFLRSPDSTVAASFDIGPPVLSNDTREIQALAYGGGTYLAVFEQRNPIAPNIFGTTEPSVVAQRIAPTGALTDTAPFVLVPQGIAPAMPGMTARLPQVAFGGDRFLVVYCGGDGITSQAYTEGQLVAPDGTTSVPFRISPSYTFNGLSPRVVFDGANFIVATGDATGWRLARVTPAGTVLDPAGVSVPMPAYPIQMTTAGAGGALVAWLDAGMPTARRFGPDLAALDSGPIIVAMSSGADSGINAGFIGGEYVVTWTQRAGPMNYTSLVLYMNRIGLDGKVQAQSTPIGMLASTVPYPALVSPFPPTPSSGYTGGYALPVLGTGSNAALLAYVSGTSNAFTFAERAMGLHGIWVHPFAR
jgi:hypothetical protein